MSDKISIVAGGIAKIEMRERKPDDHSVCYKCGADCGEPSQDNGATKCKHYGSNKYVRICAGCRERLHLAVTAWLETDPVEQFVAAMDGSAPPPVPHFRFKP